MQNTVPSNVAAFPAIKPGHRLVPAKVARRDEPGVIVYVEDPTWCVEDHVDEPVGNVEDIMHRGDTAGVYVPTFGYGAYPIQMHAWIEADPAAANDPNFRAAHVTMQDATGGSFSHLTPEMAEKVADELVGFASQLRHLARTARLANQTTGDSDPDMDEALRRARGGQA